MKRILFLLIGCFWLAGCSASSRGNTLESVAVAHDSEIEALPVAADLRVLEQKSVGEAAGKTAKHAEIEMEALAKALGQHPPSADKPDALVGANMFTETKGDSIKVIITGYPAYYANFRAATEDDLERLNMAKAEPRQIPDAVADAAQPETAKAETYFTLRYMLPVSDGITAGNINIGGGYAYKSGNFIGLEFGLTPFSIFGNGDEGSIGGGMNFGRAFALPSLLPGFYLFGGLSAGFWFAEKKEESYYYGRNTINKKNVIGIFTGARWNALELEYRVFPDILGLSNGGDGWHHQLMLGINL